MNPKVQAWLATARVANVPSVVSNVWFGIALGYWVNGGGVETDLLVKWLVLAVAGSLLYIGGNFLNDWQDREWDARHRPERALPSGVFPPLSYLLRAIRFMGLGVVAACLVSFVSMAVAVVIVALIVVYTRWHKRAVWTVVPMGLCRALLPVMGFVAVADGGVWVEGKFWYTVGFLALHAVGLFGYIAGLALTARYESVPNPPGLARGFARVLLFLPVVAIGGWWGLVQPLFTLLGMVAFVMWTGLLLGKRPSVPVLVSGFLAGIPLLEWIAAFPLVMSLLSAGESVWAHPILVNTLVLPAMAFMAGRRLQGVAPAT